MTSDQQDELRKRAIEILEGYFKYSLQIVNEKDIPDCVNDLLALFNQHTAEVEAGARLSELRNMPNSYNGNGFGADFELWIDKRIAQLSPKKGEL